MNTVQTIRELKKEMVELRRENAAFRERLATVARLEPFAPASAEYLIARLIGGKLTAGQAAHDIVCAGGKKFEVKFSRLGTPTRYTRRWSWGHPLGISGNKEFTRLILVGEVDPNFAKRYFDAKSPYVIFDVPFASVASVSRKDPIIQLTTNPDAVFSESGHLLFQRYQVTRRDLRERYNVA